MMSLSYPFIDRGRGADLCCTCGLGALDVELHATWHARQDHTPGRSNPSILQTYMVNVVEGKAYTSAPSEPHFVQRAAKPKPRAKSSKRQRRS